MSVPGLGRLAWRRAPGGRRPAPSPQVRLITRLVLAQAAAAAAVGLPFGRRHLPSILITLALVASFCLLALLARSGTRVAWVMIASLRVIGRRAHQPFLIEATMCSRSSLPIQ